MFHSRNPIYRNPTGAVQAHTNIHFKLLVPREFRCNWLHTELSGEQKMLRQTIQNRTINEMTVFSQFLQQICGTEPTKEDEALFQTLFTELKEEQANS